MTAAWRRDGWPGPAEGAEPSLRLGHLRAAGTR